jgi:hypothetical protein
MRTRRQPVQGLHQRLPRQPDKTTPALILPEQTGDAIRRRRAIREAFHDSKAHTIKGKQQ